MSDITLAGKTYAFKQPKSFIVLAALVEMKGKPEIEQQQILMEAQAKWLKAGIGAEAWQQVIDRLNDSDDSLDWAEISELFQRRVGGEEDSRPSTSSSVLSEPSPSPTSSEDEPSRPASVFGI